jgi:hypothetical protein
MHARICPAALEQDVMAVFRPRLDQGRLNNRSTITLAAKLMVRDDIFEKSVAASASQKVRRGDEHAGRGKSGTDIRDKDGYAVARQYLRPDTFGVLARLHDQTHLRRFKEVQ